MVDAFCWHSLEVDYSNYGTWQIWTGASFEHVARRREHRLAEAAEASVMMSLELLENETYWEASARAWVLSLMMVEKWMNWKASSRALFVSLVAVEK